MTPVGGGIVGRLVWRKAALLEGRIQLSALVAGHEPQLHGFHERRQCRRPGCAVAGKVDTGRVGNDHGTLLRNRDRHPEDDLNLLDGCHGRIMVGGARWRKAGLR